MRARLLRDQGNANICDVCAYILSRQGRRGRQAQPADTPSPFSGSKHVALFVRANLASGYVRRMSTSQDGERGDGKGLASFHIRHANWATEFLSPGPAAPLPTCRVARPTWPTGWRIATNIVGLHARNFTSTLQLSHKKRKSSVRDVPISKPANTNVKGQQMAKNQPNAAVPRTPPAQPPGLKSQLSSTAVSDSDGHAALPSMPLKEKRGFWDYLIGGYILRSPTNTSNKPSPVLAPEPSKGIIAKTEPPRHDATRSSQIAAPLQPRKRTLWSMLTQALKSMVTKPSAELVLGPKVSPPESADTPGTPDIPSKPKRQNKPKKPKPKSRRKDDVQSEEKVQEVVRAGPAIPAAQPNSNTIPATRPIIANATLPWSMRPIHELRGDTGFTGEQKSPDESPRGSNVSKTAPGRLHELARAFKNTPISGTGSRPTPSRRTLGLVKPPGNIHARKRDSMAPSFDGYTTESEPIHSEFLLPHEMAIRDALRRHDSPGSDMATAPNPQVLQAQSGPTDSAVEPTGAVHTHKATQYIGRSVSTRTSLAVKRSRDALDQEIKSATKELVRSFELTDTPWLVPEDNGGLLLPHEMAARRLLQNDQGIGLGEAAGPTKPRTVGNILTGKSSLADVLRERGLDDSGRRQSSPDIGNTTRHHMPMEDVPWDSLIEQSSRPPSVSTGAHTSHLAHAPSAKTPISMQTDSGLNKSPVVSKAPEQGRRVISRRSTTPQGPSVKNTTEETKSPAVGGLWDSVVGLETDFLLPYEVAAREALGQNEEATSTTLSPIRSRNDHKATTSSAFRTVDRPRLSRDLPDAPQSPIQDDSRANSGAESRATHPIGRGKRTGSNGDIAEEFESSPYHSPWDSIGDDKNTGVTNDDGWDLFSGPLLPQIPRRRDAGQPSGSDQQARRMVKRRTASTRGVERAGSSPSTKLPDRERDIGFSWDGWADDVDIFRQSTSAAHVVPSSEAGWQNGLPDWRQATTENEAKHPHKNLAGTHNRLAEPVPVVVNATHSIAPTPASSSATDMRATWDVPMGESLDDGDIAKRARGRGRREGRESRYDDDSEAIVAESIRTSKNRDRDRVRDKDQARGRGARRDSEYDHHEDWEEEWEERQQRKRERRLRKEQEELEQAVPKPPQITIPEFIAVEDLARALDIPPVDLARALVDFGFESLTTKSVLTGETAALIAQEYGFEATVEEGHDRDLKHRPQPTDPAALPERPPVVTIMGHVDHGKTTMLDYLRKSSVAAQESGGITQHIGAFVVPMSSGKTITFLDTPGHAAFLAMRQRGANATDIVVLVVAADDSVKPQTIEAINHAKKAKVPIIVAINKVDKPGARLDVVKADLAREGIELEDYGGDVQVVYTSGKTGAGMAELEESILTLSEVLDFRAEKDGMAEGWVIESSIKQVGKSAVVLVKRGTLRAGDIIVAGTSWARIRLLRNEAGQEIEEAPPGTPAEIVGWNDTLPHAGDELIQAPDEGKARAAILYRLEMQEREQNIDEAVRQEQRRQEEDATRKAASDNQDSEASSLGPESGQQASTQEPSTKMLSFIVKSDVAGSAEAVSGAILQLGNHEVQPRILRSGAGAITEWDIEHASISGSTIVSFNIATTPPIRNLAQRQGVAIIEHTIIYRLSDEIKDMLSSHLADKVSYRVTGEAEVIEIFPITIRGRLFYNIAGCRVRNGAVSSGSMARVVRKGDIVFEGQIESMKHGKKDVDQMFKGAECGIALSKYQGYETGDIIQTFEEVREARHL